MSVYDERYEIHYGYCSYYTSDPAEAAALLEKHAGMENLWCNEGYADVTYDYPNPGVDMYTRRTKGPVTLLELQYRAQRAKVQQMIKEYRS